MRMNPRALSVSACLVVLVASTVALAGDNWLGSWKLDVAASKFSPGPAPKSETLTWSAAGGNVKLTSHTVEADGKETSGTYVTKYDGSAVSWKGNPDADTSVAKRIDDNGYENTWKKGGKVTITAKVVVSADGKTLTVTQTGTNSKGQPVDNTAVFDRQ